MRKTQIDEMLLSAWLKLSVSVRNDRLVKSMSFNEILVCNILNNSLSGQEISAKDIAVKTGMLKSQVNRVLTDLDNKRYIDRKNSKTDKRKTLLTLTDEGKEAYQKEHKQILILLEKLRLKLGEDQICAAARIMTELSEAMLNIDI